MINCEKVQSIIGIGSFQHAANRYHLIIGTPLVEHFTSTPSCVSLFFLSRTNFPQNATSPLIKSPHPTESTEIFGCVRTCHLIGQTFLLRIVSTSRITASFTSEQMFAEERILEVHNIFLTGQAGTEKSFLLRDLASTTIFFSILWEFVSIKIWIIRITF